MSVPQDLIDEIDMARKRLESFCNLVNAGERQGGAREFLRQIGGVFDLLDEAVKRNSKREQEINTAQLFEDMLVAADRVLIDWQEAGSPYDDAMISLHCAARALDHLARFSVGATLNNQDGEE